jgi:hypothetical protein
MIGPTAEKAPISAETVIGCKTSGVVDGRACGSHARPTHCDPFQVAGWDCTSPGAQLGGAV